MCPVVHGTRGGDTVDATLRGGRCRGTGRRTNARPVAAEGPGSVRPGRGSSTARTHRPPWPSPPAVATLVPAGTVGATAPKHSGCRLRRAAESTWSRGCRPPSSRREPRPGCSGPRTPALTGRTAGGSPGCPGRRRADLGGPSPGPVAGGTLVHLTGSSFAAAGSVLFGATPAISSTVVSGTPITAGAPTHLLRTGTMWSSPPDEPGCRGDGHVPSYGRRPMDGHRLPNAVVHRWWSTTPSRSRRRVAS